MSLRHDARPNIILPMDTRPVDARRELILRVFPELRYGGDQDIERYFELRKAGRLVDALAVYNGPLRTRYPEDGSRILLLRLYREGDPRWREVHERLLETLGRRLAARVTGNIDAILAPLATASLRSVLGALDAVGALLSRLPGGNSLDEALLALERYRGFARILAYRDAELERAHELLRDYVAMAATEAPDEQDFVARSKLIEERRREAAARSHPKREGGWREERVDFIERSEALEERKRATEKAHSHFFDLSRLSFSPADRRRIELEKPPRRHEDLVVAYCLKYWALALDPKFERLVFLYSKKEGTRHYELYRAVRIGRLRGRSDDEILTALSGILSVRYSYSVSGDLYMQALWRRLRTRLEESEAALAELSATSEASADGEAAPSRSRPSPSNPPSSRSAGRANERPPDRAPREPGTAPAALPQFAKRPPSFALEDVAARGNRIDSRAKRPPAVSESAVLRRRPAVEPRRPAGTRPPARSIPPAASELRSRPDRAAHPLAIPSRGTPPRGKVVRGQRPSVREPELVPRTRESAAPRDGSPGDGKLKKLETKRAPRRLIPRKAAPEPLAEIRVRGGSISDHIKRLSGRNYDVYKAIFLERVREDIHRTLLAARTHRAGIFDTSANEAEDIIFEFMTTHYEDPFMDWENSAEHRSVERLGYPVPSLDPIIEACYKRL